MQKRKQKQSSIKMVDYHDGDATWRRFHEEIMENEISLLESYFCKPGEFSKEINVTSSEFTLKINIYLNIMEEEFTVQTMLRIQSNDLKWNFIENQNNLSLQCKNNNIPIEILLDFKKLIIQQIYILVQEENLSLFTICTWISDALPNYLKQHLDEHDKCTDRTDVKDLLPPEEKPTSSFYVVLIQLDHIRSRKRYLKFLQGTSRSLNISIELLEHKKQILLKVIGNSDIVIKNFIKLLKTTLVDVDISGKPCKERKSDILEQRCLDKTIYEPQFQFNELNFETLKLMNNYLESSGLSTQFPSQ